MEELIGKIKEGDIEATFVAEDHHFVFIPTGNSKTGGIMFDRSHGALHPTDNFLRGSTYDQGTVLIYCTQNLDLTPTAALNTSLYICAHGNASLDKYDWVEFRAGCLNSTFYQQSLVFREKPDMPLISVETHDDSMVIPINRDDVREIRIGSGFTWKQSINDGASVGNTGATLRLIFDQPQRIETTFLKHYGNIRTLMQFMTFRKNVSFEQIRLGKNRITNGKTASCPIAECYWGNDFITEQPRDITRCITFNGLSESAIKNLYSLISQRESRDSKFYAGFVPDSSKDIGWITQQQLRDVCTALEIEVSAQGISAASGNAFNNLIKNIKKIICESKKWDERLTDREYSYISGSISQWNGPAVELAYRLYESRKATIGPLLSDLGIEELKESDIQDIYRMRNELTHRGAASATSRTAEKVIILMGIIYSSILDRCGCTDEMIREFFKRRLLSA